MRTKIAVAILTLAAMALPPSLAEAADWPPPAPTSSDPCGTTQDRILVPADGPGDSTSWQDAAGNYYPAGEWTSTRGQASVTLTVHDYTEAHNPDHTYPATPFEVTPDGTCVEARDTVTTRIVSCNAATNGTRVEFTYTNTDDDSNRWHSRPQVQADRWDQGQSAWVSFTETSVFPPPEEGRFYDGESVSITGGDSLYGSEIDTFFLAPGTYRMKLRTTETAWRKLPNTLFVPACGDYEPPYGDPMGGPISAASRPTARIGPCRSGVVEVTLNTKKATSRTKYKVTVSPRRGTKTVRKKVIAPGRSKVVTLRQQKTGSLVSVAFGDRVVERRNFC